MVMTDPIADMLTRIRNANQMSHLKVLVPASKLKLEILAVLKKEGFIKDFYLPQSSREIIISLKYSPNKERVIKGLKRVSKPGLRVYASAEQIPKVLNGLGVALVSTSKGILTDAQARLSQVGGEVLAYIW
ncbi:SSU ribosomal protein S8p (S15Ae) [Candidatus Phytoplasma asteris]|uniref:Small ribosomal subunit protein uS8 n=4 Tax=16SrI (Aster yellows group) TaxID=3042590 RepID=RS8_AYWBP|nr:MULTISPECIES: 30S ribosomal protein S8 [16SrI (Aster yellows group)]Q2NIW8.1 RecName: Full=Small ribosomal subunit protein uS8; AltName: Full=30S ribosomal protein S8 [Aster yellows witches'-broom phytoplasma AYWB]TKA87577.1 MAG: 30S ribosomal protein S8 [Periwinkle leaf yellowing phytoplasma]WEX19936.1 MAG: 30S ribosomal protein S8 [Candidatus Phytoplasma asteris]ABC65625.1 SSU ribosomal protein S8P [Aster yellows witches'-broom phytoplasma AYWB]PEH36213.1 30S ribosomal protein S8 [New Jer